MLNIKNKENIIIISLVFVLVITLINVIYNRQLIDLIYFIMMSYYFVRVLLIRCKD